MGARGRAKVFLAGRCFFAGRRCFFATRRFVVLAALLGLTACGGEMLPEEMQAPQSTQEAAPLAADEIRNIVNGYLQEKEAKKAAETRRKRSG